VNATDYKIIVFFFVAIFIGKLFMSHLFAEEASAQTTDDKAKDFISRPNIEYKEEEGLRDPFQPPEELEAKKEQIPPEPVQVEPLPSLAIQGIVWGSSLPQAIINNKVVKVGDTIEGVRITDINKNGVTVSWGNQEYNLSSPAVVNLESSKKKPQGGNYEE
jgi:type II secretory pathway component PulC